MTSQHSVTRIQFPSSLPSSRSTASTASTVRLLPERHESVGSSSSSSEGAQGDRQQLTNADLSRRQEWGLLSGINPVNLSRVPSSDQFHRELDGELSKAVKKRWANDLVESLLKKAAHTGSGLDLSRAGSLGEYLKNLKHVPQRPIDETEWSDWIKSTFGLEDKATRLRLNLDKKSMAAFEFHLQSNDYKGLSEYELI